MEYIFETERLRIRKFEMEDAKCIWLWRRAQRNLSC
jgi:hypothetical protein